MIDLCEIAWAIGSDVAERTWTCDIYLVAKLVLWRGVHSIDDKDKEL